MDPEDVALELVPVVCLDQMDAILPCEHEMGVWAGDHVAVNALIYLVGHLVYPLPLTSSTSSQDAKH